MLFATSLVIFIFWCMILRVFLGDEAGEEGTFVTSHFFDH